MDESSDWRRERVGSKSCWVWRGWRSAPFDELEERHWTPLVIGDRLCFTARQSGRWHLVFGDDVSPAYDDAFGTVEWQSKPLYQARNGNDWFLVWGTQRSQTFPFQVSFAATDGSLRIERFDPPGIRGGGTPQSFEPQWAEDSDP
jgi:hypothetical protein